MLDKITKNRKTLILIAIIILLTIGGLLVFQGFIASRNDQIPIDEVDLLFDPEGPYALLSPRRDGNALILQFKRTSSYDSISYELAYLSQPDEIKNKPSLIPNGIKPSLISSEIKSEAGEDGEASSGGIDRGVVGTINTDSKKGEYEQEILFGTCSKNVCKYDKGVENGTLTLHIRKGKKAYRMNTQWHLQKPDVALGLITSGDNHFTYKTDTTREQLTVVGFTIVNDLTGVPKLPDGKQVFGKVYALNTPIAKSFPKGLVSIELADHPPLGAKLARYNDAQNSWDLLETKIEGDKLTASAEGGGIFAIFVNKTTK